jgi:hypothetical protein
MFAFSSLWPLGFGQVCHEPKEGGAACRVEITNSAIPTDEELVRFVQRSIQKAVFTGLHEVSLRTSVMVAPDEGIVREMDLDTKRKVAERLTRMGLTVLEGDISKRPAISLSLRLVPPSDSSRSVAYYLELSISERVELLRPSTGVPPAQTYVFRAFGRFGTADLDQKLRAACNDLLDSFQDALEVANSAI